MPKWRKRRLKMLHTLPSKKHKHHNFSLLFLHSRTARHYNTLHTHSSYTQHCIPHIQHTQTYQHLTKIHCLQHHIGQLRGAQIIPGLTPVVQTKSLASPGHIPVFQTIILHSPSLSLIDNTPQPAHMKPTKNILLSCICLPLTL